MLENGAVVKIKYLCPFLLLMISFREVKVLDINTEAMGISTLVLMENAGAAVAREIIRLGVDEKKVLVLCGTGNNGGDGLVAARHLAPYTQVKVLIVGEKVKTRNAIINFNRLPENVEVSTINLGSQNWEVVLKDAIDEADIVVDAMLGVGVYGSLRPLQREVVKRLYATDRFVVSVDVPTGFGGKDVIKPNMTVTFHDVKMGMTEENCGDIVVADIGIPPEAEKYVGIGEFVYYPLPGKESHKGNNGNVLIVGGGPFTGAPAIAASAAYSAGSDLVFIAVPSRIYPVLSAMSMNFIVHPLHSDTHLIPEDVPEIISLSKKADAVLIGPGLGKHPETIIAVQELAKSIEKPLVVDADAIYALKDMRFKGNAVFTPHKREFKDAMEDSILHGENIPDRVLEQRIFSYLSAEEVVRAERVLIFARAHGLTVVQKGREDIISDGERIKFNRTGNPGMAVGGTGDALAGIIASLLARGLEPFNAGRLGAYINGRAGELAFEKRWYSLTAEDVVQEIPHVFMEVFSRATKDDGRERY